MSKTLRELQAEICAWDTLTFPESTLCGKANHCIRECTELADALRGTIRYELDGWEMEVLEEFADIFILMSSWSGKQGYSLEEHIAGKMEENRRRQWGKPDKEGVIEHIKEGEESE
jgi:NTP pyrophosphatase (non-canonical NTP hydrolase)